jgi:hypothetical protein
MLPFSYAIRWGITSLNVIIDFLILCNVLLQIRTNRLQKEFHEEYS